MVKHLKGILLGSAKARKLADFYKNKVGLKLTMEFEMGDNKTEGFMFEMKGGSGLYITDHSKVKGKNKQPGRHVLNFEVDNIEKEVAKLKKEKVTLVQDIYHIEDYGYIATFEDVDKNYFQLVKTKV